MLPLQVLNVAIVSPHSLRHYLITHIICTAYQHLSRVEGCYYCLEYLAVRQEEESGQYGNVVPAKDFHCCGGVVASHKDCCHQ